jgi:hypothetical protein
VRVPPFSEDSFVGGFLLPLRSHLEIQAALGPVLRLGDVVEHSGVGSSVGVLLAEEVLPQACLVHRRRWEMIPFFPR